jgi:hypothetical protein
MRSNFVNNSEEELEWLMISRRQGAYKHSHKKNEAAEDRYFKALSDIETFEYQHEQLVAMSSVICPLLKVMAEQHTVLSVDPSDNDALAAMTDAQAVMTIFLKNDADRTASEKARWEMKAPIRKLLQGIASNPQKCAAGRAAFNMVIKETIPKEVKEIRMLVAGAMSASEEALRAMEKWSKREKETDDYQQVISEEEAAWMHKESEANAYALSVMRSYIPSNIADMTVKDLREAYSRRGGLITPELASELKSNRLLQWLVMHPLDIAYENFLNGEKKQYFLNLERLDVIELRAIVSVLPLRFELDGDGRKAEWRERFMTRAKQVVSQQNGDCVKGSWNSLKATRSLVRITDRLWIWLAINLVSCVTFLCNFDKVNNNTKIVLSSRTHTMTSLSSLHTPI